jgi:ribosomal-protein-alanine N-acetyltransferase
MSAPCHLRRASPEDLGAILALEQACAEAPHWSQSIWLTALSDKQATQPIRAGFVAETGLSILGFVVASYAGELAELESLAVTATARRQGVGKALCRQVMNWSREVGARKLELEVRASSEAALALYRSLGFVEQGRRRSYYLNPTEDAVLMAAQL